MEKLRLMNPILAVIAKVNEVGGSRQSASVYSSQPSTTAPLYLDVDHGYVDAAKFDCNTETVIKTV